jgi:hypothetical protein
MLHHTEYLLKKMRGVWIFIGITVCMMHAMEYGISPGVKVRCSLGYPQKSIKKAVPELT